MSQSDQLDLHPDAESLNAFVEHLLPEEERQQILAHAAGCGRCREVIYLAQEAANPESQTTVAPSIPAKQTHSWFAGWRVAWASAAACIILAAISVAVYRKQAPSTGSTQSVVAGNELAKTEATAKPPLPGEAMPKQPQPEKALPPRSGASTSISHAHPPAPKPSEDAASHMMIATPAVVSPLPATPPVRSTSSEPTLETALATPEPEHDTPKQQQTINTSAQTIVSLNQDAAQAASQVNAQPAHSLQKAGGVSAKAASGGPVIRGATSRMSAGRPMTNNAAAAPPAPVNSEAVYFKAPLYVGGALSNSDLILARNTLHAKLPNGLTAISTAAAQHRLLAVDTSGAVFLSNDAGQNWEAVAQQWTGRVIQVNVNLAANQDSVAKSPAARTAAANTPALFELVNDSSLRWTSTDGKTWKAK
jgi:hypothetical protein